MHYLDHACFSPPAATTETAVREAVTDLTSVAERDATELALEWLRQRERARTAVAHLLDVSPAEVALAESTTHGLGVIAGGLRLHPGDNVVVADCDFIGLPTVWRSQERSGVQLRAVRSVRGRIRVDSVREAVDEHTRVLTFSAVQEVTGAPLDVDAVAEIAASVGAYLILDGAQEAGVLQRHPAEHGVHAYASGGHKWLRNPYGLGFLWVSPDLRQHLHPPFQGYFALTTPQGGWRQHLSDPEATSLGLRDFRDDAAALEPSGTPNWLGAVGLAEAISSLLQSGPRDIETTARTRADQLRDELCSRGVEPMTGAATASTIVTFSLAPTVPDHAFVAHAKRTGVRLSARGSARAHGVRASCHGHTTTDDLNALLAVVDDCMDRSA